IVVPEDVGASDARLDELLRVVVGPLAGTPGIGGSRDPDGPERLGIFRPLNDRGHMVKSEVVQPVERPGGHAVEVLDPAALTIGPAEIEALRLQPDFLKQDLAALIGEVVGTDELAGGLVL